MKLVTVVGAEGMLGRDVVDTFRNAGHKIVALDIQDIDITNPDTLGRIPECDWIVNCAAYTRVDDAETDSTSAYAVNRDGAANLARLCADRQTKLMHVSSDYVFDGRSREPYSEDDTPSPINVYGASKLAGENAVIETGADALIVRTQSLYGARGRSFVSAIMTKVRENAREIRVVDDQVTSPTWTVALADAFLCLLKAGKNGIVHVAASGSCTWAEFARSIVARTGSKLKIEPVSSVDYGAPASRPSFSVLSAGRYEKWTGRQMPSWEACLDMYIETS